MTEFRDGAKVRVLSGCYEGFPNKSTYNLPRGVGIVHAAGTGYIYINYNGVISPPVDPTCFELVSPIEEAKSVLVAAGYGITEPKKPETGVFVIYRDADNSLRGSLKEYYESYSEAFRKGHPIIASSRWTEGQGL